MGRSLVFGLIQICVLCRGYSAGKGKLSKNEWFEEIEKVSFECLVRLVLSQAVSKSLGKE